MKSELEPISSDSLHDPRTQCLILLSVALDGLRQGTKAETISYIEERHWFDIQQDDKIPYPSKKHTSPEPRWATLMAWTRKDAVEFGLMHREPRDSWQLTPDGKDFVKQVCSRFKNSVLDISKCYLWSVQFKKVMVPTYNMSGNDLTRPKGFYDDLKNRFGIHGTNTARSKMEEFAKFLGG